MSDDLLRKLKLLEEDYADQPPMAQRADLAEINRIRAQLGMPTVDAHLRQVGSSPAIEPAAAKEAEPEPTEDHSEARAIYQAYLKKVEELEPHIAYADQVAEATAGHGQTPVRPLALMGTNGGPLLCDHCKKPIILEGGRYHGVPADVAWRESSRENWTSYILGGMVVEIQTNGTLRIYHGYPDRDPNHCCNIANREDAQARAEHDFGKRAEKRPLLLAFLEHEHPEMTEEEQFDLLNRILDTMYDYDPGIGVNRPDGGN